MSHSNVMGFNKLQFYLTESHDCSYLENKLARSQIAVPPHLISTSLYTKLVHLGFRRSGLYVYRPHCSLCTECLATRILVKKFKPNRNQSRVYKRILPFVKAQILDLHYSQEHFELYQKYQKSRHAGGGMDQDGVEQYQQFLLQSHIDSKLIEFRHKDTNILLMISVVDILDDGISAVYTFFDVDYSQLSLGKFNILWQLDYAQKNNLNYVYLGYYIKNCHKMNYKIEYQPIEVFTKGFWKLIENS